MPCHHSISAKGCVAHAILSTRVILSNVMLASIRHSLLLNLQVSRLLEEREQLISASTIGLQMMTYLQGSSRIARSLSPAGFCFVAIFDAGSHVEVLLCLLSSGEHTLTAECAAQFLWQPQE